MDLKRKKLLVIVLLAVTLAAAVAAYLTAGQIQKWLVAATVVMIVAVVAVWTALWRCPSCGKFLQGLNARRCPHCGRDLKR